MPARLPGRPVREVPFGLVLLIELVGVVSVLIAPQHWLRAVGVMAAGMAVAGLLRLALSDERAGLLRIRSRGFDVACCWVFALLVVAFALALPQR